MSLAGKAEPYRTSGGAAADTVPQQRAYFLTGFISQSTLTIAQCPLYFAMCR